ncbi:ketoacyl-ACP synthase III [Actinomadura sp. ATCC 31491]|uniref:Ketoacyl-ACP synthase III n=1 Tax=Actinomadura luzonensis TaxID=2805427 RepID=A0ABT0G6V9_9ACTN|nr:3-oxoacyl-[acyl-carrier-protein] synthase III C-terminal domain-containing protein [Actinomadura luzonensis]MCK2220341.1 ketoacyl-ACP synthase III [Actinomadura luzonensis]
MRYAHVAGVAVHLPERTLTSAELEEELAARNPGVPIPRGLIEHATGVRRRHLAEPGQRAADLAVLAARELLAETGHVPPALDLIIYAGVSSDAIEPATAHLVAAGLGAGCPVFDVRNACNSVANAIELAEALIVAGRYRTVLIACGEIATAITRWRLGPADDYAAVLPSYTVSDSGAAVLLEAASTPGVLGHRFCAHSPSWEAAIVPITRAPEGGLEIGHFSVDFHDLALGICKLDLDVLRRPLTDRGLDWADMAAICVHQASLPSLHAFCELAGIPVDKVEVTIEEHGNLVASTLPAQLAQAVRAGRVRRGDLVALVGVAGGVGAGTVLLRW